MTDMGTGHSNPQAASIGTPAERPVALVTGGARRLGRHIALDLARHGWNIALHYHHSADAATRTLDTLHDLGGRHAGLQADLSAEDQVRDLFTAALGMFGRVDAVINNAAVFDYDDASTFGTMALNKHMGPNLAAPILLTQELHRHVMRRSQGTQGVSINLLDQKLSNLNPDFFSYTLSKSALKTAITLMAQALAPHVRVAGLSPGLTLPSHLQSDAAFERTHRLAPLGGASTPDDISRAVRFILDSPRMTGVDLIVDGGQHLVGMDRDFSMMELDNT